MDDNIIQLFGGGGSGDDELFTQLSREITEHIRGGKDLEYTRRRYIGVGAFLWAQVQGYPHVQAQIAGLASALPKICD